MFGIKKLNRCPSSCKPRRLTCEVLEGRQLLAATIGNNIGVGDVLSHYRLAIGATAEFTNFFGGQAQALSAVQNLVAELNQIFEKELSIRLDLVTGTNTLFTNPATDGYTNGNESVMINENKAALESVISVSSYDIGHALGLASGGGGGGVAQLGSVNSPSGKARGASVITNPLDPGFIGLVAHEIAHQFGAEHTFNANAFGAAQGNRDATNAYEPASGSTLMGYPGISGSDNLQDGPDLYLHSASFEQIQVFIDGAGVPNSTSPIANAIPTVNGGTNYTIPANTPFVLTAAGADANVGDALTYTWEQLDLGPEMSLPITDNGSSPLFRSFEPSSSPSRFFPRLPDLLGGVDTAAIGEKLPTTTRNMNFRTTVRDGNGGVNSDDVLINVVNTGSAFAVSTPNTALNWSGGSTQTINWVTAGTAANGINVADVAIDLSLDGGLTYPVVLAASTPNDGNHSVLIPNVNSTSARVRVRALGNIFFDVSNLNFSITLNPASPGITITESGGTTRIIEDGVVGGVASDTYTLALNTAPAGSVSILVSADPQTQVSLDNVTFGSTVTVVRTDTTPQTVYVRGLDDSIEEGIHTGNISHSVIASTSVSYAVGMIGNPIVASIADDELQPVVGVDFDVSTGVSPTNWTRISQTFGGTTNSLVREDGIATGFGLELQVSGSAGLNASAPSSVALHWPNLNRLDGNHIASESLTLTWTGLTPGKDYNLYMFLTENFGSDVLQSIQVTGGAGNPLPFTQNTSAIGAGLLVNTGLANPTKPIESDAVIAQADSTGKIRIVVTDTSAGGTGFATLAGAAIQEIGPSTRGFSLIESAGTTKVSESGTTDSFDVVLKSQPTGNVVIDVTTGDAGEATLSASSLTFNASNWNVPQTITVTGVEDSLTDGAQTVAITLAINAALTTDNSYDAVATRVLSVTNLDNEAAPIIGVDFDTSASTSTPTNWTKLTDVFDSTTSNLINEDGTATPFDLSVAITGGANVVATSSPTNLPNHTPSLAGINGVRFASTSITLTWSDLTAGTQYDLWLFAAENFSNTVSQTVTITGAGTNPSPFVMNTNTVPGNTLLINGSVASSANNLQFYAVRATANSSGQIQIAVVKNSGNDFALLNGVAIQEVVPPVPTRDFGDAPANYPASGGHLAVGPRLGATRDAELGPQPSANADGDGSDEDGVMFGNINTGLGAAAVNIDLQNAASAVVDGWIDFNSDGDWSDPGEQIFTGVAVSSGIQTLNYTIPVGAVLGNTIARIRVSSTGGLSPIAAANDGEIQDYQVTIGSTSSEVLIKTLNNSLATRSEITSIALDFNSLVPIEASDFILRNTTTNETVTGIAVQVEGVDGTTRATLTFTGGPSVIGTTHASLRPSLANGNYTLRYLPTETPGNMNPIDTFFRKFGDADGSNLVALTDFATFRSSFGSSVGGANYRSDLDSNRDGIISLTDFAAFRAGFGS